jgi:hypothetical protein
LSSLSNGTFAKYAPSLLSSGSWEYKFWSGYSLSLGKNIVQRYVRLTIAFACLVLTQKLLKNPGIHWTAILRDVGLFVVVTLFHWSRE